MDGNLAMNYHQENISEADDAAAYEEHFVKNGNRLIADFMNWQHHENPEIDKYEMDNLDFHLRWDRLIYVVEKIVAIKYDGDESAYLRTFGMRNHDGNYMVRFNWCSLHEASTLLWATYSAVVDFIEMQNAKKLEKKVCVNKVDGSCPLHNIHCQYPKCEEQ